MRKYERVILEKGAMHSNFLPFHFRVCALNFADPIISEPGTDSTNDHCVFFFILFVYLLIKKKTRLNDCFNFS